MDESILTSSVHDVTANIENLFTLGQFEDAHKASEMELLLRLLANQLPLSILVQRHNLPSQYPFIFQQPTDSKAPQRTTTHSSQSNKLNQQKYFEPSSSTHSYTTPNSLASSSNTANSTSASTPKPNKSENGKSDTADNNLAPQTYTCDTLSPSDKTKLKALMNESVPIISIMIQCLFELNLKSQIIPFLVPLFGTKWEEYPLDISFLVVNLHISQNQLQQASEVCDMCLLNLRSQLGPFIAKSSQEYSKPVPENAASNEECQVTGDPTPNPTSTTSVTSSPSSASSHLSRTSPTDEEEMDEEESLRLLRSKFVELAELHAFHILLPSSSFAETRSWIHSESRIPPKIKASWGESLDDLEAAYLDDLKLQEALRTTSPTLSPSSKSSSSNDRNSSPIIGQTVIVPGDSSDASSNNQGPTATLTGMFSNVANLLWPSISSNSSPYNINSNNNNSVSTPKSTTTSSIIDTSRDSNPMPVFSASHPPAVYAQKDKSLYRSFITTIKLALNYYSRLDTTAQRLVNLSLSIVVLASLYLAIRSTNWWRTTSNSLNIFLSKIKSSFMGSQVQPLPTQSSSFSSVSYNPTRSSFMLTPRAPLGTSQYSRY